MRIKIRKSLKKKLLLLFLLISASVRTSAALPDFTLTVSKTDETCTGNGSLTFNAAIQPGATVEYRIYKLPDLSNAIAILTTNFLGGLTSGTYRVIAIENFNGSATTQQQDITIENAIVPLAYTIESVPANCGSDGSLEIEVFSGIGSQYEIISGPVTAPLQSSPAFGNLPAGVYQVRVFDNCGEGWVATHTLFTNAGDIEIQDPVFPESALPDCNSVIVSNTVETPSDQTIIFPLQAIFTVHPPDGSPAITVNVNVPSGSGNSYDITAQLPFYHDQLYFYDLQVTDGCGTVFTETNLEINLHFVADIRELLATCGQYYISFAPVNYVAPISIVFTDAPAGFNPADFNSGHPGPFSDENINYGNSTLPVPYGHYAATVTDACGRTYDTEALIEFVPAIPVIQMSPLPGCQSNISLVEIEIPGYLIVSATLLSGTPEFSASYPLDVSQYILADGTMAIQNVPEGTYTIELIDECGNVYNAEFDVPGIATSVTSSSRTGCDPGFGSVRIRGSGTILVSATMTSAPAAFGQSIPLNVSNNISSNGIFSMNGLPPGTYTFSVTDSCGLSHSETVQVTAYSVTANSYTITPYCGSFDLTFTNTSNPSVAPLFYLQKLSDTTGLWGHPETEVAYPEGTLPSLQNSYPLTNNVTNYNISYLGDFRIIKVFESYDNGSIGPFKNCIEIIQQFTFENDIEIVDIEKTTCNGEFSDVLVTAEGIGPMIYKITTKDGEPFPIDNGTSNLFLNLEAGVYNFQVFDACGNVANSLTDVAQLPSLAEATQPPNLEVCDDAAMDGVQEINLSQQNAAVLAGQNPAFFTITYHATLADAESGVNPLPENYPAPQGTIYVRLKHNNSANCYDVTFFDVTILDYPMPELEDTYAVCIGGNVTITANPGFDSYFWSNNTSGQQTIITSPGNYTLTVTLGDCTGVYNFTVFESDGPTIDHIETTDWTSSDNSIAVFVSDASSGNFLYSLDNVTWQESNVFDGLASGLYTIYVKDSNGCGGAEQQVYLLNYPHFFTPNGDGFHDTWQIPFAMTEPEMKIFVFDRYGKFIAAFGPESLGWDGTLNGEPLPSTDYWFKVIRQNGKEYLGHFALKR